MSFGTASSHYATGVEHWMKRWAYPAATFNQTPNTVAVDLGSQSARDNLRGQKGKNPDRRLRSPSHTK